MNLCASLWVTLSTTIFPIENTKWVEKAASVGGIIAIGKDFHYNRWRKTKEGKSIAFNSYQKK